MAWWNKVISAVKSAVNTAVSAVKSVVSTATKIASKAVSTVKTAVSKVTSTAKKIASKAVSTVKTAVSKVTNTVKKTVSEKVEKVKDEVASIQNGIIDKLWIGENEVKKKIDVIKETIKETVKEVVKKVRRATWPKRPVTLPKKLWAHWRRMEQAWVDNDKGAMLQVLRELIPMTASPIPALALILGIAGIAGLIVTLIGSYPFAGFIREEAIQTMEFAIRTATENKDIEGLEKAIAFKKELLERTLKEKILGAIPILTLWRELQDFYKAAAVKLEIDERSLEILRAEVTGEGLPERVEAVVRDIIDGDTIDVDLDIKGFVKELPIIRLGVEEELPAERLPEYKTTGHARVRIVGINAPEKSPKGEILCTGIEIFKVEKEFADKSRDALLPLNDKKVILKIDPENAIDTYGRILAVVEYQGQDIGLRQINEGLACAYIREENKYVDEDLYLDKTLEEKEAGKGMWAGLEEIEKEEDKVKIRITSTPTNAKLFLDDVALRHNTPSDEIELSDVIHLFTLGKHVLSAEKAELSAMEDIEIVKGDNGTIHLDLEAAAFEEEEVPPEEEVPEEEEEVIVIGLVKPAEIPKIYTAEQGWALKEAFDKILILTEGPAIMSEKEREDLINSFAMHTDGQKEVLKLLWRDLTYYTQGVAQLSADEYIALKEKYRMI